MSEFKNVDATRALQASEQARSGNLRSMRSWGHERLVKVVRRGDVLETIRNYVTLDTHIEGHTPKEIEDILGLRLGELNLGADIYKLNRLPTISEFLPRGYSHLVDGLELADPSAREDSHGYRVGKFAWQITLLNDIPVTRIRVLFPGDVFKLGVYPSLRHLYPANLKD